MVEGMLIFDLSKNKTDCDWKYHYSRRPLYIVDYEGQLIWPYTLRGLLIKILAFLFVIASKVLHISLQMRHHQKALTILLPTKAKKLQNIDWL